MRLSIIIPAYNNEKDIARIFDGLLALDSAEGVTAINQIGGIIRS